MTAKELDPKVITALAFDLDGTLLQSDKTLSSRTLAALRVCMDRGLRIIIATGRSLDSGEVYRKLIGSDGPQVYYNGAEVADLSAGKIIHTDLLTPEPALFCVELARKLGLYYQVYFPAGFAGPGEVLMADELTEEAADYTQSSGITVQAGDLAAYLSKPELSGVIKGMFITPEENHEHLRKVLKERYGDTLYVARSSPDFLETLAPGVSKGAGLLWALKYLGLKPENTIAFGDEENDLPMFATAGFSAAPANAKEIVKAAATFRLAANTDEGVAVFLEEWFGPKSGLVPGPGWK
ncbi:haloacid dehalogenase [Spirochaetia bacterium]|nr:haloacid dehalogenase [Spirochaetia bacterium]